MARPRSDISERIVRAARVRFLHDGVDGASQRAIARDAGTNLGMVYYYYPTKDRLFDAVIEDVYAPLVAELETLMPGDLAPEDRVRRLLQRLSTLSDKEVDVLRIVAREALISNARRQHIIARVLEGHMGMVIRAVFDGIADGTFRPLDPPFFIAAAIVGIGFVPQVMRRVIGAGQHPFSLLPAGDALVETAIDVLMHGVGGPAQGKREVTPAPHATAPRSRRPSPNRELRVTSKRREK